MRRELKKAATANAFGTLRGGPMARLLAEQRGSGLVEYAIIFTLFMTMLLAIADFSRALYAYHFVSSQAREASRYAMATTGSIQTFARNVPAGIDSSKVTATTTWTPDHKTGSVVQVEVDYTFNFLFPWVSKSTLSMSSVSQMIISQ